MRHTKESEYQSNSLPLVSVILICFNDGERLPVAASSVLHQSLSDIELIIVDDHSSDSTPAVSAALASSDPRVRTHRLPRNSGGCGAPRNIGVEMARGQFVMFLDSDDVLPFDACGLLVEAALRSGADFTAGALTRVHQGTGRTEPWYHDLYSEEQVFNSLADRPDLVNDTVATNKLYRKDFLRSAQLSFPVDTYYEDVIFTARAMSTAQGMHYIPDKVYEWRVYEDETRSTITNQRSRPANYKGRANAVAATRTIYSSLPLPVRIAADVKALRHHLTLHLNDLGELSDEALRAMLAVFAPLAVSSLPDAVLQLNPFERARFAAVSMESPEALREAYADLENGYLSGYAAQEGALSVWCPSGRNVPKDSPARLFLEYSAFGSVSSMPRELRPVLVLNSVLRAAGNVEFRGIIVDRGLRFPSEALANMSTPEGVVASAPVRIWQQHGVHHWSAEFSGFQPAGFRRRSPVRIKATVTLLDAAEELRVFLSGTIDSLIPDTSFFGRLMGDEWSPARSDAGDVEFRLHPGRPRRVLHSLLGRAT